MALHHRLVVKGYNRGDLFVRRSIDLGFEWSSNWQDHAHCVKQVEDFEREYQIVKVDVRDAG